ncbi:MAG: DNA polymerase beta superfamily protein, partial [bacterium]
VFEVPTNGKSFKRCKVRVRVAAQPEVPAGHGLEAFRSQAIRTFSELDDKDIMGVFVAPIEHYLGFGREEHKEVFLGEWDAVSYELRKLFGLLLKSNPNVLSLLWLPDKQIIYEYEAGRLLCENRDVFVSKVAYKSFDGYAMSQLKRMTP